MRAVLAGNDIAIPTQKAGRGLRARLFLLAFAAREVRFRPCVRRQGRAPVRFEPNRLRANRAVLGLRDGYDGAAAVPWVRAGKLSMSQRLHGCA
jgi:hypothetical protein